MACKKHINSAVSLLSISAVISAGTCISAPAHAQAFSSVVDVCTGVSLPRSEVTDLLGQILPPVVTPIEGTVNNVLGVVSVIPIVGTLFPDLNIDVTTILDNAAAGDPLSLQVLDNNGTVLGASDDCNTTSDGYTLNTEGGISIGGNAITGLGANGQAASAAELDAIAFGNSATTAAGATGAIALGTGASATVANSVALGAGSVADRGAQVAYTAPGLTGTFDSVGSVSVGSAGNLRQITHVAPGTDANDAATVGQVQGALDAIADLDTLAIQYDDATQASVTFGGAGGTTLTNVADGALSATSTDAVNGSQLFDTNQTVAGNTTDIATNTGDIATNTGDIATNTANIATNTTNIATNTGDIAALQSTAVQYDDASQASITLGGAGGTTVTNVADGALSATSTDAVNGAQLFATNENVAANTADIAALQGDVTTNTTNIATLQGDVTTNTTNIATNTADIAALQSSSIHYDDATHTSLTLDGAGGTTISNVADGTLDATSTEAVNGAQLFATNENVAANTTDIANLDGRVTTNETNIANLDGRVTTNETDIVNLDGRVTTSETNIASLQTDVSNVDARVTVNEGDISVLQNQIANVPVYYVEDAAPTTRSTVPTDTVAMASASGGPATLTNVAAGALSAGSTDAVNGSQLFATNQRVDQNTADIQNINNNIAGSTVVAVQYSNPDTPTASNGGTVTNDVTLVGADTAAPVALHNVANGTLPNDAVNMGQFETGLNDVLADSIAYTDSRLSTLAFDLESLGTDMRHLRKDAFAGTASAMAVAGIPQTMGEGRMIGGGIGYYRGQTAFALGASSTFNDGRGVAKVGATLDGRGHGGFSAGAGFSF